MFLSRSGWTVAILAALSVWFIGPDTHTALAAVTGPDYPQALLGLASLVQLAISGWVLLIIGLAQLSSPIVRAITPGVLRHALFVGAVGALALSPAQADRSPAHSTIPHSLSGLRLPDRPDTVAAIDRSVMVKPGDTLWAIAARSLPPGAGAADIARACARWYASNRNIIGDDPNLIHPSQHLTPPTPTEDTP
jgi:hypothetical protein